MRIDAINFIRNCYDRKILTRRFYIKLGRQNKEVVEDWACVGYVPRKYNNNKKNFNKGGQGKDRKDKPQHNKDKKEEQKDDKPEKAVEKEQKQDNKAETEQKKVEQKKPKEVEPEETQPHPEP